jgi:hypothetical protein
MPTKLAQVANPLKALNAFGIDLFGTFCAPFHQKSDF